MRIIEWHFATTQQGSDRSGEIEVDDGATEAEIDALIREEVFELFEWNWAEKVKEPG